MSLSLETKKVLGDLFIFGSGICGLVGMILLLILYFRLTRKYDTMFPNHDDLTDGVGILGAINRTGRYMWCIVRRNLSQRNERIRKVTGGYDFRGNATALDIVLCYFMLFFGLSFLASLLIFFLLTEVFGIDL